MSNVVDEEAVFFDDSRITLRIGAQDVDTCALPLGKSINWTKAVRRAILETTACASDSFVKQITDFAQAATKPEDLLASFDGSDICNAISRPLMLSRLITLHSPQITAEMLEDATAMQIAKAFRKVWEIENPFVRLD